jgi:hypothetical protein
VEYLRFSCVVVLCEGVASCCFVSNRSLSDCYNMIPCFVYFNKHL